MPIPTFYPQGVTQGDKRCPQNVSGCHNDPLPQNEGNAVIALHAVADGAGSPRYGDRLIVASSTLADAIEGRRTRGGFVTLPIGGKYGDVLMPVVPYGCESGVGVIDPDDFGEGFPVLDPTGERHDFAKITRCQPHIELPTPAETYELINGTQSLGTFLDTAARDQTYHEHTDNGGALDLWYQFDVGTRSASQITIVGRINGENDSLRGVYAYNWGDENWDRIGDFDGQDGDVDPVRHYDIDPEHVGTGINAGKIRIRFWAISGLTSATLRIDQIVHGTPVGRYGPRLVWKAASDCRMQLNVPINPNLVNFRDDVMHTRLFGSWCAFCPIMFLTLERPVIGCSFPGNQSLWFDSCADQFVSAGTPHCRPLEGVIECNVSAGGVLGDNHCEECVFERNLGWLIQLLLRDSDCLSKIPMRPSITRWGPTVLPSVCDYGCGEFGWQLWEASEGQGLRIPNPYAHLYDTNLYPPDGKYRHGSIEEPCTWEAEGPCLYPNYGGLDPDFEPGDSAAQWQSGHAACGTGLNCTCNSEATIFCVATHWFEWDAESSANRITSASVCFKQRDLCSPNAGPCDNNPIQDPLDYNNPGSEIIVDVETKVAITFRFKHWGPKVSSGGSFGCRCCAFLEGGDIINPEFLTINLTAEWCGPIVWGNRGGFGGYPPGDRPWSGLGRADGSQFIAPGGTYPLSGCANLFTDPGRYDDGLEVDPFPNDVQEPPKRCPSWVGNFEGAPTGVKFWCPPHLRWQWNWFGTHDGVNWDSSINPPNQTTRRKQCWAAQVIKGGGGGCQTGALMSDDSRQFCDDPGCRRGCALNDDAHVFDTTEGLVFVSPCPGEPRNTPFATPHGCGQCNKVYPAD